MRVVAGSYRSCIRSAELLGEEYTTRRFQNVEVGMCLRMHGLVFVVSRESDISREVRGVCVSWRPEIFTS